MKEFICDIPYASQSVNQKLDIYLPDQVKGTYPVIVYLHPGGYIMGNKDMIKPLVDTILARGYAAVSINYRLADEAMFPSQVYDSKAAVRWIRANAGTYNFNPAKIAAWGISAGGTLASLLGTSAGVKELEDLSMGNASKSSSVQAVVSWSGPVDYSSLDSQHRELGHKPLEAQQTAGESKMMGGSVSEVPDKYRALNPITYLNDKCPPFYLQHGKSDEVIHLLTKRYVCGCIESGNRRRQSKAQIN